MKDIEKIHISLLSHVASQSCSDGQNAIIPWHKLSSARDRIAISPLIFFALILQMYHCFVNVTECMDVCVCLCV